jgi:tight adherence protein B
MAAFLNSLAGHVTWLLALGTFFVASVLIMLAFMLRAQIFMTRYRESFTETASSNLADMFSVADPVRLFYVLMVAIVLFSGLVWVLFGDWKIALGVGVFIAFIPTTLFKMGRARRLKRFEQQLPDALAMISGSMRAGASLNIALESLVKEQQPPINQEFALFLREQRIGVDFEQSLNHLEKRVPLPDFGMVLASLKISREVGGNLAEVLESLADTLRRKHTMEGKIESLTAQGKLQGIVMTGLPILLAVLLNFLEPEAMSKLWSTTIGWVVLGIIIFMETLGYIMIRKITTIDV